MPAIAGVTTATATPERKPRRHSHASTASDYYYTTSGLGLDRTVTVIVAKTNSRPRRRCREPSAWWATRGGGDEQGRQCRPTRESAVYSTGPGADADAVAASARWAGGSNCLAAGDPEPPSRAELGGGACVMLASTRRQTLESSPGSRRRTHSPGETSTPVDATQGSTRPPDQVAAKTTQSGRRSVGVQPCARSWHRRSTRSQTVRYTTRSRSARASRNVRPAWSWDAPAASSSASPSSREPPQRHQRVGKRDSATICLRRL